MLAWRFLYEIMAYLIYGSLNYTTTAGRTTAQTNMSNVLASYTTTPVAVNGIAAGLNTSGTTVLTISIRCEDADIESLRTALVTAWSSAARATTGHYISAVKVSN